eukprot:g7027.t1
MYCEMQKTWNENEEVPSNCNSKSQSTLGQRKKKKGKGQRGPVTPKLPEFDSHAEKVDFMMNEFKVKLCPRRRRHQWSACPYAHRGETARRRDPNTYHAVPCPEMRQGNRCPRGDRCCYSHHDFEYCLHPARYCTVMCNKGTNCDRALCFFAHRPEELRISPLTREVSLNNDPFTLADQLSDTSSSSRNNFEKTGLSGEELISCGSYTSVPEVFAPFHKRNEEWTPTMHPPVANTLFHESSRAAMLANNIQKTAIPRPAIPVTRKENVDVDAAAVAVAENPYSIAECPVSTGLNHLLPQRHSSPGVINLANSSVDKNEETLLSRLSAKSASHFSPTCHFSGSAKEFANEMKTRAASVNPENFKRQQSYSVRNGQGCFEWMQNDRGVLGAQDCSTAVNLKQIELLKASQMTSGTQALDPIRGHTHQAMDYFRALKHSPSSQLATLNAFASPLSLFGDQFSQDLLSNVETMQLLKLHLLCNAQSGDLKSPTSSFSPSLLTPQFSREEAMSRDALYSLQEEPSIFSMVSSLNFSTQETGVNIGSQF